MEIKKETTVQKQDEKAVKTIIPAIIRDTMGIKVGTKIQWILTSEEEVKIKKL